MATEESAHVMGDEVTTETTTETDSGLDENVAGALSYLLGLITGAVFLVVEKENDFVRFHAAQSIVLSVVVFGVYIVLSVLGALLPLLFIGDAFISGGVIAALLSLVFGLVGLVFSLAVFVLWILLMFRAYQGKQMRLPVVAGFADRLA